MKIWTGEEQNAGIQGRLSFKWSGCRIKSGMTGQKLGVNRSLKAFNQKEEVAL
jgi:hypothetical protein